MGSIIYKCTLGTITLKLRQEIFWSWILDLGPMSGSKLDSVLNGCFKRMLWFNIILHKNTKYFIKNFFKSKFSKWQLYQKLAFTVSYLPRTLMSNMEWHTIARYYWNGLITYTIREKNIKMLSWHCCPDQLHIMLNNIISKYCTVSCT